MFKMIIILYADDIAIFENSKEQLQISLDVLLFIVINGNFLLTLPKLKL